jgi:hypothetical protein
MRTFAAKIAAAFATALAATGGLAAASALPAPVQSAFADVAAQVGVDLPSGGDADAPAITDPDPTTTTTEPTTSTTEPADADEPPETTTPTGDPDGAGEPEARNHGAEVSAVAHDDSVHGCEHGRAVSSVASGRPNDKPCPSHEATDDDTDEREDDADQPDEVDDDDSETVRAPNSGSPAAGQDGGERDNRGNGGEDDDGNGHGRGHGR